MRRQETANREIRGGEDNGDMTSHNNTNKPACFIQLNSTALVPWVNVRKQWMQNTVLAAIIVV